MHYLAGPMRHSIYSEIMLRSKIGMFVANNGMRYYRCIVSNVDRDVHRIYCSWIGIAAPHDLNNFTVSYKIDKNCVGTFIDYDDLEYFKCSLGMNRYNMLLPYNIKRHDEIIVNLR
jgi:hypothetical protein